MALLNFCRKEVFNCAKNVLSRQFSLFGTKKKKKENCALDNYCIMHPHMDEFNKIYKLFEDHYFEDEPLIKSVDAGAVYNPILEKEVYETLEYGYSFVAKCRWTGCIVGACLNFATSELYPEVLRKYACTIKDEDTRNLLFFYAYVQEVADLFDKYCENQTFVIRAVVVDADNRNLKLATELIRRSKQLGKDLSFPMIRCDCTHYALAKICESLDMDWENEVKYCEYLGPNYKPVFEPPASNKVVSTYIDLPLRLKK